MAAKVRDVLDDSRKRYRCPWAEIGKCGPRKEPIRLQDSLPSPLKKKKILLFDFVLNYSCCALSLFFFLSQNCRSWFAQLVNFQDPKRSSLDSHQRHLLKILSQIKVYRRLQIVVFFTLVTSLRGNVLTSRGEITNWLQLREKQVTTNKIQLSKFQFDLETVGKRSHFVHC